MGRKTDTTLSPRLSPSERLTRGLRYSAIGPVDVTRGAIGVGAQSARSTAADLRRRYHAARLARQAAAERAAADDAGPVQQIVAALPQAIQDVRSAGRRHRRLWVFGSLGVLSVVGGAVAFKMVRRSSQPEPSSLSPTVEVASRP